MSEPTGKLKFAYSTIMAHEATIAEQGAEIAELVSVAKTLRSLDEILSPKSRGLLDALLTKHKDKP